MAPPRLGVVGRPDAGEVAAAAAARPALVPLALTICKGKERQSQQVARASHSGIGEMRDALVFQTTPNSILFLSSFSFRQSQGGSRAQRHWPLAARAAGHATLATLCTSSWGRAPGSARRPSGMSGATPTCNLFLFVSFFPHLAVHAADADGVAPFVPFLCVPFPSAHLAVHAADGGVHLGVVGDGAHVCARAALAPLVRVHLLRHG